MGNSLNRVRALILPLLVVVPLLLPSGAGADSGNVLQVIKASVAPENIDEYVERVERLLAVQERLQTDGKMRMWRAAISGSDASNVIVSIEYYDLNAFAANFARLQADLEWQEIMKGLPAIRKLLSSSLFTEITP